jgi:hypothetical protein
MENGQSRWKKYSLSRGTTVGRRDQHAVCSLHGLPVGPLALTTPPVPLRKPRARHDLNSAEPHQRHASVCGPGAVFRSGFASLDASLRSPLHFPPRSADRSLVKGHQNPYPLAVAFDREKVKRKAAERAAKGVFVGTSSWKYEDGWTNFIRQRVMNIAAKFPRRGSSGSA